tara:strand:+ start:184 stop:429 length:246 start_codon:yes stop_codon:yes gene_type:complete
MELKLKRKTLKITLDEKVYDVRFPTVQEVKGLQDLGSKGEKDFAPTLDFLDSLGLPRETCMGMEPNMILEVIKTLSGEKKR